ncbi:MBL fold metallo-hydrolase [Halomicrobium katesii]|uniref:MBL fold metallo-hydrolase n=1 Tax=Halomicrobium katesii TaxID=437163 RepID=UPI0003738AC4|nr:MBL fold metallo-hydrolase [Halomicrobium katesii]
MSESYPDPPVEPATITPETLAGRLADGERVRLLDVRDRDEYERWHIAGPSVTATQHSFAKALQAQVRGSVDELATQVAGEGPITVVCARGEASAYVAGLLTEAGVDAHNLAGGMDGWARVYEAHELDADEATIVQYQRPASGCLGYQIVADGVAAVVDPLRAFADRYAADATRLDATIEYVIDTHVHADHVSGLRSVATATGGEALVPARAHERGVVGTVGTLADGETRSLGETTLRAVALPGHTTGMTGVAVGDVLLTGDSLFLESVARPDLEASDDAAAFARELYATLTERLDAFDDETLIAPGHVGERTVRNDDGSYAATLGPLRERLWAFAVDEATFVERVTENVPPRPANAEAIVAANLGRRTPSDDDAFEWELGPNNCAATAE